MYFDVVVVPRSCQIVGSSFIVYSIRRKVHTPPPVDQSVA